MTRKQTNVKVSKARPVDWAVRKAEQMHAVNAAAADRSIKRDQDREAARLEQLEARRASRRAA